MDSEVDIWDLVNHIFLPLRLPGAADEDKDQINLELIRLISNTLKELELNEIPKTRSTFANWATAQSTLSPKVLQKQIQKLDPGDTFAFYVQAQNACISITIPEKNHKIAIYSGFPTSQKSEIVVRNHDLASEFPSISISIPRSESLNSICFAKQLISLYGNEIPEAAAKSKKAGHVVTEVRDVSDPKFILKWLPAALVDAQSKCSSEKDLPRIVKKIRDSVILGSAYEPFRRSGCYLAVKIILQISLIKELGPIEGLFLYKMIMIRSMNALLEEVQVKDLSRADILMQMMSKIGRRMYKLSKMDLQIIRPSLDELYKILCEEIEVSLKSKQNALRSYWEKYMKKCSAQIKSELIVSSPFFQIEHGMESSGFWDYLSKGHLADFILPGIIRDPDPISRHLDPGINFQLDKFNLGFNQFSFGFKPPIEKSIHLLLFDFEHHVLHGLSTHLNVNQFDYISKLFQWYLEKAQGAYDGDPIGNSRLILTCLKMLQIWDQITTEAYPLLKNYQSGIEMDFAKDLLCSKMADLKILNELEIYFENRNRKDLLPSLIEESEPKGMSFAVKYAETNSEMEKLRLKILEADKKAQDEKISLVKKERETWKAYSDKISLTKCDMITIGWKTKHARRCERCILKSKAGSMKVEVHEKYLPESILDQRAVVFELAIPGAIAVLRDLIVAFNLTIIQKIELREFEMSSSWHRNTLFSLRRGLDAYAPKFTLYSSNKPVRSTHFSKKHVSSDEAGFIMNNGMNTKYALEGRQLDFLKDLSALKKKNTFQVEMSSPYSKMQWAVNGMELSANEVIARQYEQSPNISTMEFIEFGSLRCYPSLQYRNILIALTKKSLSFKTPSVLSMIQQALYQAGPPKSGNVSDSALRVAHIDFFNDTVFSLEFIVVLEKMSRDHRGNWQDNNILLSVVFIISRIASITRCDLVQERCIQLLSECRNIALKWSDKIQNIIAELLGATSEETDQYRIKLLEVNVCAALTFNLEETLLRSLMENNENIILWLQTISRIHDCQTLSSSGSKALPNDLRNLIRRVKETGGRLQRQMARIFRAGDCSGLNKFVMKHYSGSDQTVLSEETLWHSYPNAAQVYFCKVRSRNGGCNTTFQLDIVEGSFLVDGSPVQNLSRDIVEHTDFRRTFPNKVFIVQPYPEQPGTMITKDKFGKSYYTFHLKLNGELIITEHRYIQDKEFEKWVLIPEKYFRDNVAGVAIKNCTHWWNKENSVIEFYALDAAKPIKLTTYKSVYQMYFEEEMWRLAEQRDIKNFPVDYRWLVDINCSTYRQIVKIFSRIELVEYINIWTDAESRYVDLELPRLGLTFSVINYGAGNKKSTRQVAFISKEFRGLKVSSERLEALVGLESGILLEDANTYSKAKLRSIFIVPFGKASLVAPNRVKISINETDTVSKYFAYEIDSYLRQLKAGESQTAWVYLAYLHAITASPFVEPFTCLTGTERSFEILHSGHVWSSEPYDSETLKVFEWIRGLAPVRSYNPPHKIKRSEKVTWPQPMLSSIASHDGYHLIVQKLVDDSLRLTPLYPEYKKSELDLTKLNTDSDLCLRAYWRRYKYSTEGCRLTILENLNHPPNVILANSFDLSLTSDNTPKTIQISRQIHEWTGSREMGETLPNKVLKSFLLGNSLIGISPSGFPYWGAVGEWIILDPFKESWMDLYKLARIVADQSIQSEWLHILTSYAFRETDSVPLVQLQILQLIAANSDQFPEPPKYESYSNTGEVDFNAREAEIFLTSYSRPLEDFLNENKHEQNDDESIMDFVKRMEEKQQEDLQNQVKTFVETVQEYWPCKSIPDEEFNSMSEVEISMVKERFNQMLKCWYQNRDLDIFLGKVEAKLEELWGEDGFILPESFIRNLEITESESRVNSFLRNKTLCTILLRDIFEGKNLSRIQRELWEKSKKIYNFISESTPGNEKSNAVEIRSDEEPFPLEMKLDNPIIEEYMGNLKASWAQRHKIAMTSSKSKINGRWTKNIHFGRNRERLIFWENIKRAILPQPGETINKILQNAGIFPRITEPLMLKLLVENEFNADCGYNEYTAFVRDLIGSFGVMLTKEMQGARMVRFAQIVYRKPAEELEYRKELQNPGHVNWIPSQKPSWLLFEIDMDLMIRDVQVTVAQKMMHSEGGKNSLLQLNMGEGKTAVIIPLLVLALADGGQLCRVTVLRSLYQINRKLLLNRIGGLNGRRLYNFPCRRDYKIGIPEIQTILNLYQECMEKRGIVMTVPEYRLSFELKMYEKGFAKEFSETRELLKVQEWLRDNARDLLDESDEILQVKYQIIYTLGPQIQLGGGSLRWKIIQDLMKLVPKALRILKANHEPIASVEINERASYEFPFSRILDMSIEEEFINLLAKFIVQGQLEILQEVSSDSVELVTEFLTNNKMPREEMAKVYKKYPAEQMQESLLILRGLLAAGVIANTLSKRWRVNYGINPNGYRKMAVPFRAKDVAAERTEFGHPDVAICLTQLTYYYSGLTDAQIEESFDKLLLLPDPNEEYQRWMSGICTDNKTLEELKGIESIRHLSGVNLQDYDQRKILFPLLRTNMQTIDFWLSTVVYPVESKQFGLKIGCSPWDLCRVNEKPCTGFSGTSDSKLLLPKTISQNDIPELEGTDGFVLQNLMREENDFYQVLGDDIGGKQIIDQLALSRKKDTIRVLLDVGALMIDLGNRQVVEYWLSKVDEADAGVYFDEKDKLMVLERKTGNRPVLLELSTFRTRLDRCVIYLDDIHTRGTDLKLPEGTRACLTLGKGVTKDKLVQGAMRMRKLGIGHRVAFWASQEVHNLITSKLGRGARVGVKDVIKWTIDNNMDSIQSGFIHWINAGAYQAQKRGGHSIYNKTSASQRALKVLADNCNAPEVVELKDMYGESRVDKSYPTILEDLLKRVKIKLGGNDDLVDSFGVGVDIMSHVAKYASDLVKCTQELDEEQERELEPEIECERQREVPPKPEASEHSICKELGQFIQFGTTEGMNKWAIKIPRSFILSKIWDVYPMDNWAPNIYATRDFCIVIKETSSVKSNDFIRPPNFLVTVPDSQGGSIILFISPIEADHFMPYFRTKNIKGTLRLFAPRLYPEQGMLYNNPRLGLPSASTWPDNIVVSPMMHSSLLLFSGSSYFESKEEMRNYIAYLGLCPQPRSAVATMLCEKGWIVNGFALTKYRNNLGERYEDCQFDKDPQRLVREIIEGRFKFFSNSSHVGILVMKNSIPPGFEY